MNSELWTRARRVIQTRAAFMQIDWATGGYGADERVTGRATGSHRESPRTGTTENVRCESTEKHAKKKHGLSCCTAKQRWRRGGGEGRGREGRGDDDIKTWRTWRHASCPTCHLPYLPHLSLSSAVRCMYALLTISRAVWRGGTSGSGPGHSPRPATVLAVTRNFAILRELRRTRECFPDETFHRFLKFRLLVSFGQLVNTNYAIFSRMYLR